MPLAPRTSALAVVYLRTAQKGAGLDVQEAGCRAHAARMGWPVVAVFRDDGVSGLAGAGDRPGLQSTIDTVKATPGAVVVVYDVWRLARCQSLLLTLLDDREGHGLPVSSVTGDLDTATPTGRAMLRMMIATLSASSWASFEAQRRKLDAQRRKLGPPSIASGAQR